MIEEDPKAAKEAFHEVAAWGAPICPSCKKPVKHRAGVNWCIDHRMSEATLQKRVMYRAKKRQFTVAHAGRGWVGDHETGVGQFITPMLKGWPDLFFLKEGFTTPAFWMELKKEDEQPDEDQWRIMKLLIACGIPGAVIRPSDLREGRVDAILDGR